MWLSGERKLWAQSTGEIPQPRSTQENTRWTCVPDGSVKIEMEENPVSKCGKAVCFVGTLTKLQVESKEKES